MDIFKEFILTVLISVSLAFLIAKLVSAASSGGGGGGGGDKNNNSVLEQENIAAAAAPLKSEKKKSKKKKGKEAVEVDEKKKLVIDQEMSFVSSELKNTGLEIEKIVEESVQVNDGLVDKIDFIITELSDEGKGESVAIVGEEAKDGKTSEISGDHSTDEGKVVVENLVVEMSERNEIGENSDVVVEKESELKSGIDSWESDEEEWEGIERSEVENFFATASTFVNSGEVLSRLSSDVQMQLYGLHKVATEGPCYEPQPMALMVSARAKWHAWQRLGNMSPEAAMEQYAALLSENVPGWTGINAEGENKQNQSNDSSEGEISGIEHHNLTSSQVCQPVSEDERKSGDHSSAERSDGTEGAKIL